MYFKLIIFFWNVSVNVGGLWDKYWNRYSGKVMYYDDFSKNL